MPGGGSKSVSSGPQTPKSRQPASCPASPPCSVQAALAARPGEMGWRPVQDRRGYSASLSISRQFASLYSRRWHNTTGGCSHDHRTKSVGDCLGIGHGYTYTHVHSYFHPHTLAYADQHAYSYPHLFAYADGHFDAQPYTPSDCVVGHQGALFYAGGDNHRGWHTHAHLHANAHPHACAAHRAGWQPQFTRPAPGQGSFLVHPTLHKYLCYMGQSLLSLRDQQPGAIPMASWR